MNNIKTGISNTGDAVVDDVIKRTAKASVSADPIELAQAQIALQRVTVTLLQQIDWKLWELYNKFAK